MIRIESFFLLLLFSFSIIQQSNAWAEWNYTIQWAISKTTDKINSAQLQWNAVWSTGTYAGDARPPRPRRGHSLHILQTDDRSDYGGDIYIFLFGGRDNDQLKTQIPTTYALETVSTIDHILTNTVYYYLN
jgi:hypothetical protein